MEILLKNQSGYGFYPHLLLITGWMLEQ